MAFSASTGARAPAFSPVAPEVIQGLRDAVNTMDSLSQNGFSEIAAIAKLALRSLESPDG